MTKHGCAQKDGEHIDKRAGGKKENFFVLNHVHQLIQLRDHLTWEWRMYEENAE